MRLTRKETTITTTVSTTATLSDCSATPSSPSPPPGAPFAIPVEEENFCTTLTHCNGGTKDCGLDSASVSTTTFTRTKTFTSTPTYPEPSSVLGYDNYQDNCVYGHGNDKSKYDDDTHFFEHHDEDFVTTAISTITENLASTTHASILTSSSPIDPPASTPPSGPPTAPSTLETTSAFTPITKPPPSCIGQCTIAAATINLIVWPDQTAENRQVVSRAPITSVTAGLTLTHPSVYFSLQSLSAYETCGSGTRTVDPKTTLPTFFPFDPTDISTITWTSWSRTFTKIESGTTLQWWTASWSTVTRSFDFAQLASCSQGTYGYSFPAISVTSAASGTYFTGASTGISPVSLAPCSPIFAIPTKITNTTIKFAGIQSSGRHRESFHKFEHSDTPIDALYSHLSDILAAAFYSSSFFLSNFCTIKLFVHFSNDCLSSILFFRIFTPKSTIFCRSDFEITDHRSCTSRTITVHC
ncbi:hypothetical protein BC567DRAFT_268257 [Phyllosticta citribraziliensis]